MGWFNFRRRRTETRSIDSVPWDQGGSLRASTVSESDSLGLAAVWSAARFLSDYISTLPLHAYRRLGEDRQRMGSLPQLLQFMAEDGTLTDWVSEAVFSLALHGNAIGLVLGRDGFGFPTSVQWRPKTEFYVDDTSSTVRPQWYWNGRRIDRSELVHIRWMKVPGKTLGLSPIEHFALTVGTGLKSQRYGYDWFDAGGVPPGTFKNSEKKVDQAEADVIKSRLVNAIKSRKPIVYGADWDYNAITIPPEQAQFIETAKLNATQVANIFGIHPEEVGGESGGSLTYNTEELREIRRASDARPWFTRLENGLSAVLPERQFVKFNADAAIRADLLTRYKAYALSRTMGLHSIDEIRALEDLPPLPNGEGQDYTPSAGSGGASSSNDDDGAPALTSGRSLRVVGGGAHDDTD